MYKPYFSGGTFMQRNRKRNGGNITAAGTVAGGLIVCIITAIIALMAAAALTSKEVIGEGSAPWIIAVSMLIASAAGSIKICTKNNENKMRDLVIYCGILILALLIGAIAGKTPLGENRTAIITICCIPVGAAAVILAKAVKGPRRRR